MDIVNSLEFSFHDVIKEYSVTELPKIESFPTNINDLNYIILYGPYKSNKYKYALSIINKYSKKQLKYQKKCYITINNKEYIFKISDIHIEINMEHFQYSSKNLWEELITQIENIAFSNNNETFIILCKNFHKISKLYLDDIYTQIKHNIFRNKTNIFKYLILTESLSMIPYNIINISTVISSKSILTLSTFNKIEYETKHINILLSIIRTKKLEIPILRNALYDILSYNLDVAKCFQIIIENLVLEYKLDDETINNIYINYFKYISLYNDNYRPIFHLERIILYFMTIIHT